MSCATSGDKVLLNQIIKFGRDAVDAGSAFVPDSVPRQVAKGLVVSLGIFVAFNLIKTVFSTAVTVVLLGVVARFFVTGNSSGGEGKRGDDADEGLGDEDDPLEEARRIMSKYK